MSFGQQRLWFGHELEPGAPHNALGRVYEIQGPLNADALSRAFDEVMRRHETLRTTFHLEHGTLIQRVEPYDGFPLTRADLSDRPLPQAWSEVDALLVRELHERFDPARGPVLRGSLVTLTEGWHALVLTLRFIGADRWSRALLHRELSLLYEAFCNQRASPLAPCPVRYIDFAAWQRERLSGERLERLLDYWTATLRDAPRSPRLLPDRAPAVRSRDGGTVYRRIPASVVDRLIPLCVWQRVTPFMLHLAALGVLLHRLTGDTDIVVGAPTAGRLRPETEALIGFFGNTLVLRTDLSGDPRFVELLQRVRRTSLDGFAHQELPFEKLIEALPVEREPFSDPLARVLFAYQNLPDESLRLEGCTVTERDALSEAFPFELAVSLYPSAAGLLARAQYQTDLFSRATIVRLLARYETLLEGIAFDATTPISRLPIMEDAERVAIRSRARGPSPVAPTPALVHRLVEAQACRTPDAIALSCTASRIVVSYRELEARAESIAGQLRALAVGRGTVVAVAMARSTALYASLLGVLKAGGAYLPIERGPESRTRTILSDCGAEVALSDGTLPLPQISGIRIVDVRGFDRDIDRQADDAGARHLSDSDLAYVMYTSGSSGAPKGVEIPHRAVVRLALAGIVPMAPGDVVLQLAPVSFDASTFEIWTPLAAGARLAWYPESAFDLDVFEATVRCEGVTHLWLTASLFNTVVDLRPGALAGIRYLLVGGEALSVPHVRAALERYPALRLFNGYGPTEVTTFSLVHEVQRPVSDSLVSVPLGRPIAHTVAIVLDGHQQAVPVGVPGELYLGGRGLARGYRNAPELTTDRFVEVPVDSSTVQRLYRTGDRVRYLDDGAIEYLGRLDRQVKLRGFRIELDEIETHLRTHDGVAACAVTLESDRSGERGLIAFVVPRTGAHVSAASVRAHLAIRVPQYMVPATILIVDALPATSGGKLDRQSLERTRLSTSSPDGRSGPATALQDAVADIWREVLGSSNAIGPHDNFFDAGGHSLLAVQVIARLRATFDVGLPLSAIFEHPTLAALADLVGASRRSSRVDAADHASAPTAHHGGRPDGNPASFGQLRLWFLDRLDAESSAYNSSRGHLVRGPLDVDALRRACDAIVERHAALRTRFVFDGQEPRQIALSEVSVPFDVIDLRSSPPDAYVREAASHAVRPFDLTAGPLVRVLVLRLEDAKHLLQLTAHHIAVDGWSMGILGRELGALYDACASQRSAVLDPLPIDYADYAVWQREQFRGSYRDALLGYWRTRLTGLQPFRLPDAAAPEGALSFAGHHRFILDAGLVHDLRAVGRETGATLFMVLLAGFNAVLTRLAVQDDVAVAVPVANRSRREFEGIVGFFVNTLVLRTSLAGNPTGREVIARVRQASLEAYDHQECPFEQVVDDLRPPREQGRSPLTSVLFALQTAPDEGLSMTGLEVTRLDPQHQRARFDLELMFRPAPDGTLSGSLVYGGSALTAEAASDVASALERILRAIVNDLDAPLQPDRVASVAPTDPQPVRLKPDATHPLMEAVAVPARFQGQPGLTLTEAMLARLWRELLDVDVVGPDDDFFELGGHSLRAVQLFARIESERGRRLPVSLLFRHGTIRQLARVLDDERQAMWAPVVPLSHGDSKLPLFLVHGIGGEVIGFRLLAQRMREARDVYAIQAPGPGAPPDLPFEVEALCARYVDAVLAARPDGPCVFGGYSAGGVFAIEMARQARARGVKIPLVVLIDGGLPPGVRRASRSARHTPGTFARQASAWIVDEASRLRPADWPKWLGAKLRAQVWRGTRRFRRGGERRVDVRDRFGTHGIPAEYHAWVERRFEAFCRYPMRPYEGPIVLVRSRSGSLFGPPADSLTEDWRHLAAGGFSSVSIACSHRALLEEPHVRELAAHVEAAMAGLD